MQEAVKLFHETFNVPELLTELADMIEVPAEPGVYECRLKKLKKETTRNGKGCLYYNFKTSNGLTVSGRIFPVTEQDRFLYLAGIDRDLSIPEGRIYTVVSYISAGGFEEIHVSGWR